MARRGGTNVFRCPELGCTDNVIYTYDNQEEYRRQYANQAKSPWKCSRHRNPEEVVTPRNPGRQTVLIAQKHATLDQLYWREETATHLGSGFTFGPGFKAHADDFPAGTRLVVTVTAHIPDPEGTNR